MSDKPLKRILYLEDDLNLQKFVNISLSDIGKYELKVCGSGREVLEEAEEFNPDLFLLDIMLPDMSGPSVLKELRNNPKFKDTPAIFISAKFIGHEFKAYRELGVLAVIRKPFDPLTLPSTIKAIYEEDHEALTDIDFRTYKIL